MMVSNPRYGVRVPTEECPAAIIVMSCQCIVGVIIQVQYIIIIIIILSVSGIVSCY